MIVLGFLLLAAAAAFGIDLVATNAHQVDSPVVFGQTIAVHTDWWVFLIGAITGAVALLGLSLMTGGAGRGMRRRRMARRDEEIAGERERFARENKGLIAERDRIASEHQELLAERERQAAEHQQVLAERDRLSGELERHRSWGAGAGVVGRDERTAGIGSAERPAGIGSTAGDNRFEGAELRHDERVAARDDAGVAGREPAVDLRDAPDTRDAVDPAAGERELATSTADRKRHFWER